MIVLIDYPNNGWCHLVADTIPNLHEFAKKVGLKRHMFSNKRGKNQPHYDVKEKMIQKCIDGGANQVSSKEIVIFLKQNYTQ